MILEGASELQRMILADFMMSTYKPVMPALEDLPFMRKPGGEIDFGKEMKGVTAWRCCICGHIHYADKAPEECPVCFFPASAFKKVWPQ
jgi:acyl-CoA dehydrogenase